MRTSQPLHGIRVLDLTTFLSGPFCTQILGDLGADVLKLEPPDGDSSRRIPPYFVGDDSAYYLASNRNKRSITIDLKTDDGLAIVRELIARTDVVVENFRPGVCRRLGLDVDEIRGRQPELVWASISGFGQDGPWRDRPAYDMIVQALSGVMSLTGEPGRPSVRLGIPAGDLVAGMYGVIGILAALIGQRRDGLGSTLDVSMLDCQLAMLSYQAAYATVGGVTPEPQAARHDSIPTYRTFTAGDGRELAVTANTPAMWESLCAVLDVPELVDDERFVNAAGRLRHAEQLWARLEPAFLRQPAEVWVARLIRQGVPAARIKTVPEALADAEQAGRGMVLSLESAQDRQVRVVGNPIIFHGEKPVGHRYPPALGEDTDSVLEGELGMCGEHVDRLRQESIVGQRARLTSERG